MHTHIYMYVYIFTYIYVYIMHIFNILKMVKYTKHLEFYVSLPSSPSLYLPFCLEYV